MAAAEGDAPRPGPDAEPSAEGAATSIEEAVAQSESVPVSTAALPEQPQGAAEDAAPAPEVPLPAAAVPEATVPEAAAPEAAAPEAVAPEAAAPEATVADDVAPEAARTEAPAPEAPEPEAATVATAEQTSTPPLNATQAAVEAEVVPAATEQPEVAPPAAEQVATEPPAVAPAEAAATVAEEPRVDTSAAEQAAELEGTPAGTEPAVPPSSAEAAAAAVPEEAATGAETAPTAASTEEATSGVAEPALPAGWEVAHDEHGNRYYCCRATGESSWTPPAVPEELASSAASNASSSGVLGRLKEMQPVQKSMQFVVDKSKAVQQRVSESERVQQSVQFMKKKTAELAESERVQKSVEYAKHAAEVVQERTHQGIEFAKEKTKAVRTGAGTVWEKGRGSIQSVKASVSGMAWRGSARETLNIVGREEEWKKMKVQGAEEITVPARTEHTCAFHVTRGSTLRWTFRVKDYDIGFGVRMRVQEWGGSREEEVLPVEKYDSTDTVSGSWVADENRTMVLAFDNKYSRFRSKNVAYLVGTEKPEEVPAADASAAAPVEAESEQTTAEAKPVSGTAT